MSSKLFNFLNGLNDQRTRDGRTFMGPAVEEGGSGRVLDLPNIDLRGQGIPLDIYREAKSTVGWPFVDNMLSGRVTAQALGAEDGKCGDGKVTAQAIGAESGGGKVTALGVGASAIGAEC